MKKLILFFVFFSLILNGQTHRFIYEVNFRKDSTESVVSKENYHLDIKDKEVLNYNRDFYISDSIMKQNKSFPAPQLSPIYIHERDNKVYNEYEILGMDAIKLQSESTQQWNLSKETKKVGEYNLQKATTNWGGRNWTAWFAPEIPIRKDHINFMGYQD